MVIPVTASEINLSKSSRNTCKMHKPVELQSLWKQGFTKEDYKFPSGLNNARCSQFFFFFKFPVELHFYDGLWTPPEKLPCKSKNQDLIPSTLMLWLFWLQSREDKFPQPIAGRKRDRAQTILFIWALCKMLKLSGESQAPSSKKLKHVLDLRSY